MKVFITGATGYIGFNAALALRCAGHEVWGLARSGEKAVALSKNEIHSVLGEMQKPATYASIAEQCSVLIHAAVDYQAGVVAPDKLLIETFLNAAKRGAQPKAFIYTSGVWVNGNTGDQLVDETAPLNPKALVAWRPAHEQMVLQASGMRTIVLRPGCVYGKQGGLTGMWFNSAYNEKALRVIGDGHNRWAMVHVDDLADAYVRAVESNLSGEIFNIVDRSRASVREIARAVARVTNYSGEIHYMPVAEAAKTLGDFAECLALDQHLDGRKAVRLLGWQPKHGGLADGIESYFEAWRAAQA